MLITTITNSFLPCSDDVGELYTNLYQTVKDVYLKLLSLGLRALVYNGDTDMACNFLGDQWFVEDLGFKVGALIWKNYFRSIIKNVTHTLTHFFQMVSSADHKVPVLDS